MYEWMTIADATALFVERQGKKTRKPMETAVYDNSTHAYIVYY